MFMSDETLQAQSGPGLHHQVGGAQYPGVLPPLQGPHAPLPLSHHQPHSPHQAARRVELAEVEAAVTEAQRGDVEVVVRGAGPGADSQVRWILTI